MIFIVIISLLLALLIWLLAGPVILRLNTENNRYQLALPGIFSAAIVPTNGLFRIRGWILFIPVRFDPFKPRKKKRGSKYGQQEKKKRERKRPARKRRMADPGMIREILGVLRIRKLRLDLDTDDFALNAWLIPAFSYLNGENVRMRVNFEGQASLLLDLRTRLGSLIWIFMKNRYRSFINL